MTTSLSPTSKDFKAKFNLPADATEDDLTEEGVYKIGGFKAEWTI